jgi:very-short-patch-repair endonuclease
MRKNPRGVEHKVWTWLRARRFMRLKFRRQVPVGPYILDFYCESLKLVVELDGSHHDSRFVRLRDIARTRWLRRRGMTVVRLRNDLVRRSPDHAVDVPRHAVTLRLAAMSA